MKQFLVFMTDLALAPLQGQNPRGGYTEDFDDLTAARGCAEKEKENWDRIFIFQCHENGELERLAHYQKPLDKPGHAPILKRKPLPWEDFGKRKGKGGGDRT